MKSPHIVILIVVSGISAVDGWLYGKKQDGVNWAELSEQTKKRTFKC